MPTPLLVMTMLAGLCLLWTAFVIAMDDWRDTVILWVPIGLAGLMLAAGTGLTIAGVIV